MPTLEDMEEVMEAAAALVAAIRATYPNSDKEAVKSTSALAVAVSMAGED